MGPQGLWAGAHQYCLNRWNLQLFIVLQHYWLSHLVSKCSKNIFRKLFLSFCWNFKQCWQNPKSCRLFPMNNYREPKEDEEEPEQECWRTHRLLRGWECCLYYWALNLNSYILRIQLQEVQGNPTKTTEPGKGAGPLPYRSTPSPCPELEKVSSLHRFYTCVNDYSLLSDD